MFELPSNRKSYIVIRKSKILQRLGFTPQILVPSHLHAIVRR
jgi:hypothetical protein